MCVTTIDADADAQFRKDTLKIEYEVMNDWKLDQKKPNKTGKEIEISIRVQARVIRRN